MDSLIGHCGSVYSMTGDWERLTLFSGGRDRYAFFMTMVVPNLWHLAFALRFLYMTNIENFEPKISQNLFQRMYIVYIVNTQLCLSFCLTVLLSSVCP